MVNESLNAAFDDEGLRHNAKILVIGVGGGGSNAVNGMIEDKKDEIDYWVFNTDCQALANSPCPNKFILGRNTTRGLGAGGLPSRGREAAEDSYSDIQLIVKDYDLCFLAVGEGGGTGTGAAPVVAKAAKDAGCLVLAIVTRPFEFEGKERKLNALEGIAKLKEAVDAMIVVSNDKMAFATGNMKVKSAFAQSDTVLAQSVKTLTDLILIHGMINLDFADVKTTLTGKGTALIGIGIGQGKNKAVEAANNAINSPLLESSIRGARSMIVDFAVSDDTSMEEVVYAVNYITESAGGQEKDTSVKFGLRFEDGYTDTMRISIIATDFNKDIVLENSATQIPNRTKPVQVAEPATPVEEKAPVVVKEIEQDREESPLPDYLKDFFSDEEEEETSAPTPAPSVVNEETSKPAEVKENTPVPPQDDEDDDVVIVAHK